MIIISGASGFVGANLIKYLVEQGEQTMSLSLREEDWLKQIPLEGEAIVHLAGKAHDTSNTSQSEEYFKINCDLTIALFSKFLESEIRDFFYFSSVKAVADSVEGVLDEEIVGMPETPYGKSKLEAEKYLLGQKLPTGKRLFIIRPCMIHGPGNKGNLNLLYKVVEKGIPWFLASFKNQRSFLSIDNLSFLIEKMIKNKNIDSGVYNFSDDQPLSTNELVKLISSVLEKKAKLWYIPLSLIQLVVRLGDILPLPINSERLKKLTESYIVSNHKIKKALGIEVLPLSTREGMIKTIHSFKSQ